MWKNEKGDNKCDVVWFWSAGISSGARSRVWMCIFSTSVCVSAVFSFNRFNREKITCSTYAYTHIRSYRSFDCAPQLFSTHRYQNKAIHLMTINCYHTMWYIFNLPIYVWCFSTYGLRKVQLQQVTRADYLQNNFLQFHVMKVLLNSLVLLKILFAHNSKNHHGINCSSEIVEQIKHLLKAELGVKKPKGKYRHNNNICSILFMSIIFEIVKLLRRKLTS